MTHLLFLSVSPLDFCCSLAVGVSLTYVCVLLLGASRGASSLGAGVTLSAQQRQLWRESAAGAQAQASSREHLRKCQGWESQYV